MSIAVYRAEAIDPTVGYIAISHYSPGGRLNSCKLRRGYAPDSRVNRHFVLLIQPTEVWPRRYWLHWCSFVFIYLFISRAGGGGVLFWGCDPKSEITPTHSKDIFPEKRQNLLGGGALMSRHTGGGGCRPNGLLFHQKSLNIGSILVKKSLEGPISQNLQKKKKKKNCTIRPLAVFDTEKPLQMGLNLRRFRENCLFISPVLFCFVFSFSFLFFFLFFFFFFF